MRSGRPQICRFHFSPLFLWPLLFASLLSFNYSLAATNPPSVLDKYTEISDHELIPDPAHTVDDLFTLFQEGRAFTKEQMERLGPERFMKAVKDGQMVYEHPEKGVVEFTNIDKIPAARIIYDPTDVVYLFVDSNLVEKDSAHLKKYLAKQHHLAGMARDDGMNGRDVVLIWLHGSAIADVEHAHKPSPISWVYWQTYAQAHYKKPTLNNFVFGAFCGTIQAAAGFAVNCVASLIDPSIPLSYNVSMLNFAFGTFLGTYAETYASWVYSGKSKMKSITKSSVVSGLYAYTLVGLQGGLGALMPGQETNATNVESLSYGYTDASNNTFGDLHDQNWDVVEDPVMMELEGGDSLLYSPYSAGSEQALNLSGGGYSPEIEGLFNFNNNWTLIENVNWVDNNLQIVANIGLNNYGKVEWAQKYKVLKVENKDTGKKYYRIPFTNKEVKVTKRDINFQLKAYLPAQAFRTVDLLSIGIGSSFVTSVGIFGSSFDLKYSTMLFIASSVGIHTWTRRWAARNHPDAAKKLKLDESYKNKLKNSLGRIGRTIKNIVSLNPTKDTMLRAKRRRAIHQHTKEAVSEMRALRGMKSADCSTLLEAEKAQ